MPAGPPTKYKAEYADLILEGLKEGKSFKVIASELDLDDETISIWRKKYPELSATIKRGLGLSQGHWESVGYKGMMGEIPGFNATIWIFNMKNRFGWRDRLEVRESIEEEFEFGSDEKASN